MNIWLFLITLSRVQSLPVIEKFSSWNRAKRDTSNDNIKGPLDRLKMIARITNGIYLQQGFISGTIPPEEFISEILFFGSVTPSDIVKIEHAKIQASIDSLKDLPSALESAKPEIGKVETAFDGYSQILEGLDGVGNIDEWGKKEKVELKKDIDGLATKGITSSLITELSAAVTSWAADYSKVMSDDATVSVQTFVDISSGLKRLIASVSKNDTPISMWSFKNSKTAKDGISPIMKTTAGVETFLKNSLSIQLVQTDGAAYIEYVNGNSEKLKSISSSRSQILTLRDLIAFIESRKRTTKHTFGMPDGSSDLSTMLQNLNDPWIKEVVGTDALKTVFDRFSTIESLLKESSSSLKVGGVDVNRVLEFVDMASNIFSIANLKTVISQGSNCPAVGAKVLSSQKFLNFKTALDGIDQGLVKLKEQYDQLSELLKTPDLTEMCNTVIEICKQTDLPKTIEKFKKYEKMSFLDGLIKNIKSLMIDIEPNIKQIQADAVTANTAFADFDKYHTELSHYSKYFKCLQDHKELGAAIKLIENVKKLRSFKTDPNFTSTLKNGMTEVKKVLDSKEIINKLKTELGKMKGFKSTETDALNELKDAKKHSEVIGFSVEGVSNMENVRKKREIVENVVDNLKVIEENSKVLTDPKDLEVSNRLIALKTGIQKMYKSLDDFNKNVKSTKSTVLKDHSPIFKQAKSVTGITGNFYEMSELVTKMKKMITKKEDLNKLETLKSSLNTMESMHLDFVKYHKSFVHSEDSLKSIDTFFSNFRKALEKGQSQKINWLLIGTSVFIGIFVLWAIWFLVNHFLLTEWNAKRYASKSAKYLIEFMYERYKNAEYETPEGEYRGSGKLMIAFSNLFVKYTGSSNIFPKSDGVSGDDLLIRPVSKKGAVKLKGYGNLFKDGYYHANIMRISRKRKIIMAQPPQKSFGKNGESIGAFSDKSSKVKTNETIGKFYWMAKQYGTETIVMLSKRTPAKYFPLKKDASLASNDMIITCSKIEMALENRIEIRFLKVEFKGLPPFNIRHVRYIGWIEKAGSPKGMELSDLIFIHELVAKDKKPVIYHCENGIDRTGCVAFIERAYEQCIAGNWKTVLAKTVKEVPQYRTGAMVHNHHYALSVFALLQLLIHKVPLEDTKVKDKFDELQEQYLDGYQTTISYRSNLAREKSMKRRGVLETEDSKSEAIVWRPKTIPLEKPPQKKNEEPEDIPPCPEPNMDF